MAVTRPGGRLRRLWDLPFGWHAAALALILLSLLPLMSLGSSFTSDDGIYALQVQSLDHGSWAFDYRAAPLDPEGTYFPLARSTRSGDSFFHVSHPLYPVLMLAGRRLAGPRYGLHVVSLLGALAAAAAAWLLASELDPRSSRFAFWLVAASPAVANGYLLWAHSLSAALAGVAMAAAVRVVRRGATPLVVAALAAALAAGALLRSEAVLFALVVAGAIAVYRARRHGLPAGIVTFVAVGGPTGLAVLVERRWTAAILGRATESLGLRESTAPSSYLGGRASGAWHELFNAHYSDPGAMLPVLVVVGLVVGLGFLTLRQWRPRSRRDLVFIAAMVVVLVAVRMTLFPDDTVTGLFAAWPLGLLGLLLLRRGDGDDEDVGPAIALVLVIVTGFVAAVVLTQYPEGGGLEWGGRFLSPIVVPVAVLAVLAFRRRLAGLPLPDRRVATACLSVVAVATAGLGVFAIAEGRAANDRVIAAFSRHPAPVMVTTVPELGLLAWRTQAQLTWMLTDEAGLPSLFTRLGDRGLSEVAVVTDRVEGPGRGPRVWPDGWTGREVDEPALRDVGLGLFVLRR